MMIKKELKSLCISKSLLCLLAMFLMLLAPQAAWAQDPVSYGLTVAGVPVTSTNANNITGGGISGGTVSYDGTNTLTLNGVTINGSIVVSSDFGDLVVKLVGNSVIQGVYGAPLTSGISTEGGSNSGKLTFVIDGNTSGSLFFPYVTTPIAGFANIEYLNGLEWGCRDEGTTTDYVEGVGTEVVLASIGANLYVTKTKTTMTLSNNGGTVTYRKDDTLGHVLTLSGLTDLDNCISWYSPNDVKIEISGTNSMSFSSSGGYNYVCFDGKPQSNISFRFTGATATLKMYDRSDSKSLEHPWISGFGNASNPTLSDGLKMVEIDEYRYDSQDNQTKHVERYITTETYGLNVKGIQVHNLEGVNVGYKDHILGLTYNELTQNREYDTSITFNSTDNILTLNNANISYTTGNAIVSSITTPLTVHLTSENSISSGDYLPFVGAIGDNANLVFTTNTTGTPGSLTMTSTHTDFGPTSFFDGFKQILYPEEQGLLAAKSVNGNVVISQETGYGLKVAGIVVTEANKDHVLGNDNETVKFTPAQGNNPATPATLTLNGARFDGTIIWTSSDNLTVEVLGSNEVDTKHDTFFAGNSNANITLITNSETPGTLRLTSCYSAEILSGWKNNANVIYIPESSEGNAADYSWWADGISEQWTLRFNKIYNLWVNNVQLCSVQNRIDNAQILNSYISFNGSDTLTFNNYRINTDTSPFIKSGLSNLKINLIGENSVGCGQVFLAKDGDGTNKDFTFTAEGNGSLVITTTGGATNAWYTGHNEPTFKNDLVLTDNINNTVRTVTIAKPVAYDLTIAGTPVTSANAGNVFAGGANDGKVSFTASVGVDTAPIYTLTLNGATLTGPVVVGLPNLTIDIQGTNSITTNTTCIQKMTDTAPVLTFKSTSNEVGSLTLTNTSTETTGVNNISNISISNKLALIMSRYDNYTSNTYYFTAGEVHNAQLVPSYGVQVNDMQVYEGNATNVLGDNKVSFDKSSHTLTLNNVSGIEAISTTLSTLDIDLVGNNSLYRSSDGSIFESASGENVTINLKSTGATKGSLTMQTGENSSATFKGNNVTLTADNSLALLSGNLADNKGTLVYGVNYDLWISDTRVTAANASNVLGDQTPTVVFDESTNTLTLNGANLVEGSINYSGTNNLTVAINGNSQVSSINYVSDDVNNIPKLTITKASGVTNCSLALNSNGDGSVISGFSALNYGTFNILSSGPMSYGKIDPEENYVCIFDALTKEIISDVTFTTATTYPIWAYKNGETTGTYVQITADNSTNVLDEQTETKSVTYDDGTLTLTDATINSGSNYAFVMGDNMSTLNVVLVGENTVTGNGFQFTASSPSLTFKTNGTDAGSLAIVDAQNTNYNLATTDAIIYQNGLVYDAGTKTVGALSAPTISSILDGLTGERTVEIQGQSQGTVKYSLTYADSKLSANNVSNQEYSEAFKLLGPATIKATVTVNEVVSPEATAYYFGILPNPLKFVYDGQTAPTFTATLYPNVDGVSFTPSGSPGSFVTLSEGNMTITGFGSGKASADINASDTRNFTILTDTIGFMMEVVPSAPTISPTATLEGDEITITAAEGLDGAQIYYSWDSDDEEGLPYEDNPPTAQSGTLYAWVKMNDCTSSKAERTFSVKKNIANAYVQMTSSTATYTGSAITPEFVVKESENADASTIDSANYDVTYQYKSANANEYSDVTEIKNVGNYKIVITGKGEAYGGSQEIEFQVKKASITDYAQWASPAAKEGLTYTGEEQELVTVGTVPTGVTIKYYVAGSADANPYQEEGGWSAEIPERQEIGTYYIFCKADASENYEAWPAGDDKVCLTVSIEMGTATLTATDQTSEYAGEPIEYSKDHVTVNPSTVSKENVGIRYYMPNSDSPLEVAPTGVGTYIVRFYLEDNNYTLGEEEYTATLTITPKGITADMVTLSKESYTYDGNTHTPTVGVGYTVGQTPKTLTGDDYDISYQLSSTTTNVENPTDAGTYNVVVTGKGNYSGTATKSFTINPASIEDYTVSVDATQYTYTGSAIRPSVTVTIPNVGTLDAANYTVSYENNVNAANENATNKPTVIVTGIGNYTGTTTANFTINKADITGLTVSENEGLVYDGTEQDLVTVSNVPSGATVKYYFKEIDEEDFEDGSFNMICEPNDDDYTTYLPTGTNAGYFGIVYMVDGGNNYNKIEATATMKVAIYPAEITSVTLDKTSMAYTGTAQTVTITSVKAGTDDSLDVPSTGYTVTLDGVTVTGDITAKDVKEYTVAVTGKGNFTGTVSATFTIVNRTLAAEDVTFNNHWSTFYSADGAYELPEGIGAYVATGAGENSVTVTQISNIPEKVAVLLNDETTTTSTAVFGTDVKGNMLVHATNAKEVTAAEGDFYGLFNGRMKRVMGTIPAGKNYLLIPAAVNVNAGASQLTIVIDGETTDVNDVRSKMEDVRGDLYDLQGRKVQKPSKKGLYIQKGRKVVNK